MENLYKNHEGYADPTIYEAVFKPQRYPYMPLVYIASPYAGDVENNVKAARRYARFAIDHGFIPIVPHLLFPQFMSEKTERDLALFFGLALIDKCTELWASGEPTLGMGREIAYAKRHKRNVRYFDTDMKEVNRDA